MDTLDFVYDPFCEKQFWNTTNINTGGLTNPLCALTGLFMTVMAIYPRSIITDSHELDITLSLFLFILCKASLAVVGVGTLFFHLYDDQSDVKEFNFRMADRFTMVLMCMDIFILYFVKLFPKFSEKFLTIFFFCMYVYVSCIVLAVDSRTYEYFTLQWKDNQNGGQNVYETSMNAPMLLPLAFVLAAALYYKEGIARQRVAWTVVLISINVAMWLGNSYGCRNLPVLFVFHALFHILIAYTFVFAACVGMTLDGEWDLVMCECGWPMIEQADSDDDCSDDLRSGFIRNPCAVRIRCT